MVLNFVEYTAQGEDGAELITEVARHVHAFNREHDNALGIDFPAWEVGTSLNVAERIRVFGNKDALSKFIAQPRGLRLLGLGTIARTALAEAPAGAPTAAVVRDNAANKTKPSHARRREARGCSAFAGVHAKPGFALTFASQTTKQDFQLKMRKKSVDAAPLRFNSYGLCVEGGLPQF